MALSNASAPQIYLGTMTFGWNQASKPVDEAVASDMVKAFVAVGGTRVDTARIYAGGATEPIVRTSMSSVDSSKLLLGTKAHPSQPKGLSPEGLQAQLEKSFECLGVQSLEEYYLHQPDTEAALLDSLKVCHELVKQGKIKALGMSNYHAKEVERAFQLCEEHGLTKPTVYQGLYNPLNRAAEDELIPILHKNDCAFIAYNPLAAGLLTGRHSQDGEVAVGRFKDNPNYLPRFYTDANFKALEAIRAACDAAGISMVEATYRWLLRHSALKAPRDGLLLGASSMEQLQSNLAACVAGSTEGGNLPAEVVAAFDGAWEVTREGAFPYWRSYSSDMPGRENMHPGASYSAAK
eukprot:TRINITY_DN47095_c0_g1_i1.p1 TRINITY_DN47095_c0_g1~~TRINITY_DN47095_c0_g1_i1.p1  ORF type:complete len:350 (+),score=91.87 TRINITY_DN47095_c0_g1_i1:71-1120(+)